MPPSGYTLLIRSTLAAQLLIKLFVNWGLSPIILFPIILSIALQKWLSSAVGEPLSVKAVIALPGWHVSTTKKSDIAVMNGKNPENFFNVTKEVELSEKQIKQIAHQLENLCRNVEPRAYTMPK